MAVDPWSIDASAGAPAYNAGELRLTTIVPFMAGAGVSLGARSGVRPSGSGTDLLVQAQVSPNMSVQVRTGIVIMQGAISTTQGAYTWALDAVVTRTIAAAHATLARTDLVVVRIRDAGVDTSGARDGDIVVITGTAGSGVPSLPTDATYFTLAQIAVRSTGSGGGTIVAGDIADKRVFTAALGGTILCTSTTRPASPAPGDGVFETDTGRVWRYYSGGWVLATPDSGWTDYSAQGAWSAAGGGFVIGTTGAARNAAKWRYIGHKLIELEASFAFGTTAPNTGTGNFRLATPTGHPMADVLDNQAPGTAMASNGSGGKSAGAPTPVSTALFEFVATNGAGFFQGGAGTFPAGNYSFGAGVSTRIRYTEA